jgi:subtilase family serine protease
MSLNNAILYAVENELGAVISNSYGAPEALVDAADLTYQNEICEFAASMGISVDFSSGDSGDFLASNGVVTVSAGASSPWTTGVGGVSVFLKPDLSIWFQTGWGTQLTRLATAANAPVIPPLHQGFVYGAGGGVSGVFPKPAFQDGLPGANRLVPDVALIADPYTGVALVFSPCGDASMCQSLGTIGGTSASCPMFSGLWTDINQITEEAFGVPAGQAAQLMYSLPPGSLYDVTSFKTPTNVAGVIFSGGPPSYQDPTQLMTPLDGDLLFPTAFYHSFTSLRWYDMGFGMDSSLHATPGWDDVTGNGTPNGINFAIGVYDIFP